MQSVYQIDMFESMPFPSRPLCSDDLNNGLWRVERKDAMRLPYIQANPQKLVWVLLFDVDRPAAAYAWQDADLPPPTWTTTNPDNGHAHLAYALTVPVACSDAARLKPMRLLARIEHAMTERLGADKGFVKLITKTPAHERWITSVWRQEPYDLDMLREWLPDDLPLPTKVKKSEAIGIGRNVSLFEALRTWAYKQKRHHEKYKSFHQAVMAHAVAINTFETPLRYSEIKATAKSIAKWTWKNFNVTASDERFSRLQSHRATKTNTIKASRRMDRQAILFTME